MTTDEARERRNAYFRKRRAEISRQLLENGHLEPVTNAENVMRGFSPHAVNARRKFCPKGHEYVPRKSKGRTVRYCRTCQQEAARRRRNAA